MDGKAHPLSMRIGGVISAGGEGHRFTQNDYWLIYFERIFRKYCQSRIDLVLAKSSCIWLTKRSKAKEIRLNLRWKFPMRNLVRKVFLYSFSQTEAVPVWICIGGAARECLELSPPHLPESLAPRVFQWGRTFSASSRSRRAKHDRIMVLKKMRRSVRDRGFGWVVIWVASLADWE